MWRPAVAAARTAKSGILPQRSRGPKTGGRIWRCIVAAAHAILGFPTRNR